MRTQSILVSNHGLKIIFFFFFFIYLFIFPLCSMGAKLHLNVYIFFSPPFVLLQHEYLDILLNAIQQDLLVNLF